MLNLFRLSLRLVWPALIWFIDTNERPVHFYLAEPWTQAIPVVSFKVAFSSAPFGVLAETVKFYFAFLFPLVLKSATGNSN
jgi:hypothetical protein